MDEKLHWLDHVMRVRKRNRLALLKELPENYHWLATCRKTQIPAALLKMHIDSGDGFFSWPKACGCPIPCDFCVEGNSASAIAQIEPIINKVLSINAVTWWKRYVRHADPLKFNHLQKTIYCFNLIDKPQFFSGSEGEKEEGEEEKERGEKEDVPEEEPKKQRADIVYRCKICHLPKKGHKCCGIAPPPIPEPLPDAMSNPVAPPPLQSSISALRNNFATTAVKRDDFASMFVEEKTDEKQPSRLEKIFKKARLDGSTRVQFEKIETEIDLFGD